MKPVLIFGSGQVAQVMAEYLAFGAIEVAAFVLDDQYMNEGAGLVMSATGIPVVAVSQLAMFTPEEHAFIIGMSFKGMNAPRAAKFEEMKALGYEPMTYVDERACITGDPESGMGCFIMEQNVIQPYVSIGDNCILWSGSHFGHHTKIGNHVFIASHAVISGAVEIGDHCFVGVGAAIRDGVKIGPRCVIGAGALILHDCEPAGVYMGVASERRKITSDRLRGI